MIDRIDGVARAGAGGTPGERDRARRRVAARVPRVPVAAADEAPVDPMAPHALEPVAAFLAEVARLAGVQSAPANPDADAVAGRMRAAAAQALGAQARVGAAGVHALLAAPADGSARLR